MRVYYNEIDAACCTWLQALMDADLIPQGVIDPRSICDVQPEDLDGYVQCHFFAGLGGWAYAASLAGWPEYRELWTGSCPCQPFSLAGRKLGVHDPRHLWPDFFRLIRSRRPAVVMGEQTAAAAGYAWLDGVGTDLDREDYAWRACDIPACAVDAPHIRGRLYWVAYPAQQSQREPGHPERSEPRQRAWSDSGGRDARFIRLGLSSRAERWAQAEGRNDVDDGADAGWQEAASGPRLSGAGNHGLAHDGWLDDAASARFSEAKCGESGALRNEAWREEPERRSGAVERLGDGHGERFAQRAQPDGAEIESGLASSRRRDALGSGVNFWDAWELAGPDPKGRYRRVKPGIRLLAHGIPGRVAQLRGLGNAIVPQEAVEVIRALNDCEARS